MIDHSFALSQKSSFLSIPPESASLHTATRASARSVSAAELPDLNRTPSERVKAALAEAWRYYSYARLHDEGFNYLQSRGISVIDLEAELGRPVVGHTPHKSPDQLIVRLNEKGFTDDELVDAGLARRTPGRPMIDAFRDRVMVPVRDDVGDVIGFIGRYDGTRGDVPKYLNCTKTITYDKSVNLYRPSKHTLDPGAQVIVCEGTLDALAIAATAASAGLSAKFAPVVESGLAISDTQWETILAIHPGSIVLCADGDEAGRRANAQWAAELAKRDRNSVITFWPDGDDPASYLAKHGPSGLASVTRAEANRPLDDTCRRQGTYPVQSDLARAILMADPATRSGRPVDLSAQLPLGRFGHRQKQARLRGAATTTQAAASDTLSYTSRIPNIHEAISR